MIWLPAALTAISASMQYLQGMSGAKALSEQGVRQLRETYAAGLERERSAADQARAEQQTIGESAARGLSMARVLAAEGAANLASRASAIAYAASSDSATVEANRQAQVSTARSGMAAGALTNQSVQENASRQAGAAGIQFLTSLASTAAQTYAFNTARDAKFRDAINSTSDYKNTPLRAMPFYNYYFGKKS